MLFNSIDFIIFLPIVFILYWLLPKRKIRIQNLLLMVASYLFYGWWDWRFLSLIFISTLVDYTVGYQLGKITHSQKRKALLWISILINLGFLGFFKYFNFFVDNFVTAFSFFGQEISGYSLQIILPVGISFYTFQTLSYTIDVYRQKIAPTTDFIAFAAFVSFFPQLVAGPIERAANLLPQFKKQRKFSYPEATEGLKQMLWGFFKKMVIADNCAQFSDIIFSGSSSYNGSTLLLGALFFTFQIYGDFSGYSDIAIGTARLFGFKLMQNFAYPYFSRDIAEFWRRWHISLSTWFRDYLYIPIGGSKGHLNVVIRNTFVIFIVSGFWHGANWTFIFWGSLNALYFLPLLLAKKNRKHLNIVANNSIFPTFKECTQIAFTFSLTVFAWIFFRAQSLSHAIQYIKQLFSLSLFAKPSFPGIHNSLIITGLVMFMLLLEWRGRRYAFPLSGVLLPSSSIVRWSLYSFLIFLIGMFALTKETPFIYFQF